MLGSYLAMNGPVHLHTPIKIAWAPSILNKNGHKI